MVGFPVMKLPELSAAIHLCVNTVKEQGSIRFLLFFMNQQGGNR